LNTIAPNGIQPVHEAGADRDSILVDRASERWSGTGQGASGVWSWREYPLDDIRIIKDRPV
jgi:hypothetical protein